MHDEVVINDCPPGVRYQLTKRTLHVSPPESFLLLHCTTQCTARHGCPATTGGCKLPARPSLLWPGTGCH